LGGIKRPREPPGIPKEVRGTPKEPFQGSFKRKTPVGLRMTIDLKN